jgi:hypothetical protein
MAMMWKGWGILLVPGCYPPAMARPTISLVRVAVCAVALALLPGAAEQPRWARAIKESGAHVD